jgi:hypothetical protein
MSKQTITGRQPSERLGIQPRPPHCGQSRNDAECSALICRMRSWIAFQSLAIGSAISALLPTMSSRRRWHPPQQTAVPELHVAPTPHPCFVTRPRPAPGVRATPTIFFRDGLRSWKSDSRRPSRVTRRPCRPVSLALPRHRIAVTKSRSDGGRDRFRDQTAATL